MNIFIIAISLSVSIILACSSFYLALHGIQGWGWFLFGALITFVTPTFKEKK